MKLSKPQLELLRDLATYPHGRYVADYYPPAKVLARLGLAAWFNGRLAITGLGILTLKEQPEKPQIST